MTQSNMKGNSEGIKLWNLMSSTEDEVEKEYFSRLKAAASKYHSVWFTDIIAQRNTNSNQTFFYLNWKEKDRYWDVSLFHVPEGASKNIRSREEDEWDTINPDDVMGIDE